MRSEFINAVKTHQAAFNVKLPEQKIEHLADYYELVLEHNPILHLVGRCSPEEFAVRHILESLVMLEYLPQSARFADVGAGAGLPSIPCLLVREDLTAILIESKSKKAKYLGKAAARLGIENRAVVIDRQFEETEPGEAEFITVRALDRFSQKLPRLLKWAKGRRLLLFGGPALGEALGRLGVQHERDLLPESEQRYLFIAK